MLAAATIMAGRVAIAARAGLAAVITQRYGRSVAVLVVILLAVPNVATIAADAAGVASVLGIVTGLPWETFVPIILAGLVLVLRRGYAQVKRVLTILTLVLLSYVAAALIARPDWGEVARATLLPTLVMAHMPFALQALGEWLTGQQLECQVGRGRGILAEIEELDRVRVFQLGGQLRFAPEPFTRGLVESVGGQDLQSHVLAIARVRGVIHRAEAAATDALHQPVIRGEHLARGVLAHLKPMHQQPVQRCACDDRNCPFVKNHAG